VGQESNLQPAVVEFALPRSSVFGDVRQAPSFPELHVPPFAHVRLYSPQLASKLASRGIMWHRAQTRHHRWSEPSLGHVIHLVHVLPAAPGIRRQIGALDRAPGGRAIAIAQPRGDLFRSRCAVSVVCSLLASGDYSGGPRIETASRVDALTDDEAARPFIPVFPRCATPQRRL
jgi:hypothetical protein